MKLFAASFNPAVIEDWVALGAKVTAKDSNGNNALHLLALEKSWMISNMPWSFCLALYWKRITMKDYVHGHN